MKRPAPPGVGVGVGVGVIAVALASCGGKPAPETGPQVSSVPLTRVQVEDAEPDDGVEVISTKGHVEPAVVEAAIAPHRDALTACYLQRIGKRRWLGGQLTLRWEVAADGTVEKVLLAENNLGAWPVEKCVLDLARETSFGPPIGGPAEVMLPLTFSARGTPGQWNEDESTQAVGAQLAALDACAPGALDVPEPSAKPGKPGKLGKLGKPGTSSKPGKSSKAGTSSKAGKAGKSSKLDRPNTSASSDKAGTSGSANKAGTSDKPGKSGKSSTSDNPDSSVIPEDVVITIYVGARGEPQSVGFASASSVLEDAWATCAEQAVLAWHLPDPKGQVTKLAVRYRPR